jgi:tetratricopeptide (TPR) repeat protein
MHRLLEDFMSRKSLASVLSASLFTLLVTIVSASPAAAQTGGVRGKVVDEAGKPVVDVQVVIDSPEGLGSATLKTDAKGEFFRIGMRPGDYSVKATKGPLTASLRSIHIGIGDPTSIETLTIRAAGARASGEGVDNAAVAKKQAELQNTFKEGKALADAGKFDEAIVAYTKVSTEVKKCVQCFVGLGDVYLKKGDKAQAEANYKLAIEADAASAEGYAALATFYNTEKRFDDASKMSAKAMELSSATGATDPLAAYNQGIILWNQGKIAEAKAQFAKTVELNPKMADAHYWLGMAFVNEGKMPDAGKSMTEYLKLAPTGNYADTAKAILASIK